MTDLFVTILFLIIQLLILATLWGILMALKNGFNQVIRGLEAIEGRGDGVETG